MVRPGCAKNFGCLAGGGTPPSVTRLRTGGGSRLQYEVVREVITLTSVDVDFAPMIRSCMEWRVESIMHPSIAAFEEIAANEEVPRFATALVS